MYTSGCWSYQKDEYLYVIKKLVLSSYVIYILKILKYNLGLINYDIAILKGY